MRIGALAFAVLCIWSIGGVSARSRLGAECLKGLAPTLIAGSFSGSTDCERDQLTMDKVGAFRTAEHRFTVYANRYRLKPVYAEGPVHGGERIVIMRDGHYFGQYGVIQYGDRATMRGSDLILSPDEDVELNFSPAARFSSRQKDQIIVHLGTGAPPRKILFDGEEITFFK